MEMEKHLNRVEVASFNKDVGVLNVKRGKERVFIYIDMSFTIDNFPNFCASRKIKKVTKGIISVFTFTKFEYFFEGCFEIPHLIFSLQSLLLLLLVVSYNE